jgi:hypothetical protein
MTIIVMKHFNNCFCDLRVHELQTNPLGERIIQAFFADGEQRRQVCLKQGFQTRIQGIASQN